MINHNDACLENMFSKHVFKCVSVVNIPGPKISVQYVAAQPLGINFFKSGLWDSKSWMQTGTWSTKNSAFCVLTVWIQLYWISLQQTWSNMYVCMCHQELQRKWLIFSHCLYGCSVIVWGIPFWGVITPVSGRLTAIVRKRRTWVKVGAARGWQWHWISIPSGKLT